MYTSYIQLCDSLALSPSRPITRFCMPSAETCSSREMRSLRCGFERRRIAIKRGASQYSRQREKVKSFRPQKPHSPPAPPRDPSQRDRRSHRGAGNRGALDQARARCAMVDGEDQVAGSRCGGWRRSRRRANGGRPTNSPAAGLTAHQAFRAFLAVRRAKGRSHAGSA